MSDHETVTFRVPGPSVVSEEEIEAVRIQLDELIHGHAGIRLAVDFGDVKVISSRALGMLVAARKGVREEQGRMSLFNIGGSVNRVFEVTRMERLFPICATAEEAHQALTGDPTQPFWREDSILE